MTSAQDTFQVEDREKEEEEEAEDLYCMSPVILID